MPASSLLRIRDRIVADGDDGWTPSVRLRQEATASGSARAWPGSRRADR